MKWSILLILILFILSGGYAQSQKNEYKKLVDSAISIMSQKILKTNKSLSDTSDLSRKSLYLIDENNLSYNYAGTFSGLDFKGINVLDSKNKSVIKKGIHAWKIIPALQGSSLKVIIIEFLITYKSGTYNYANGGGSETIFEYSCNENKWILTKSKYEGL